MDALVNRLTNSVNSYRRRFGFTIIELLIVMSILGIATTLVSAAYLSFEKRERVKSAALDLKSNLRLAQNKALSGDKGIQGSGEECPTTSTLVGWFVRLEENKNSYDIVGACQNSPVIEVEFATKTVNFPEGVSLTEIWYESKNVAFSQSLTEANLLFRPIDLGVYTFNPSTHPITPTPPFI